ncbi:DUF2637 domain-containing protein [Rhodococcus sp. HM1]|uniref:DUF2637 domain-containing protein n=1 Tax=Rhodococcus sp. HM1 TaxID=2937759 RepID=UPI002009FC02|nr:DUF2637 domain-containing protein [Rhodococcus sp. HM1]MCK8674146.1 DUF2637 domain-containing protein [Rhodococcus sp. HM1]
MTKRVHDIDAYATITIAALAFGLSYTKLTDLALRAGYDPYAAHAWPLIVDGLTIVATRGVLRLTANRSYAWALLAAGTTVSVIAAVANHLIPPGPLPPVFAAAVSVVPPLCLLVAPHLAVLLARDAREQLEDSPTIDIEPETATATATATAHATPEDRRAHALELLATGMSLRAVAREIGVSDTSVRKWRDAEAAAA